jgi:hypothetical protein
MINLQIYREVSILLLTKKLKSMKSCTYIKSRKIRNHPFDVKKSRLLLFGLVLLTAIPAYSQTGLIGQYPLTTKYWNKESANWGHYIDASRWDVSGNGKHGKFVGSTELFSQDINNPGDYAGEANSLFDEFPVLNSKNIKTIHKTKGGSSDSDFAYLKLPADIGIEGNMDFSISFWYYVGADDLMVGMEELVVLKNVEIKRLDNVIRVHYKDDGSNYYFKPTDLEEIGWHHFALTYSEEESRMTFYQGTMTETGVIDEIWNTYSVGLNGDLQNRYTTPRIMTSSFIGALWNVRLFDTHLSQEEFKSYAALDVDFVSGDYNRDHYFYKNVSTYYSWDYENNANYGMSSNIGGTMNGEISIHQDRFGESKAVHIPRGANLTTNSFFDEDYDPQQGYTISFWIEKTKLYNNPMYTEPSLADDQKRGIFYALNNTGEPIFGMQSVKEILGTFRYSPLSNTAWYLWFLEPINFNSEATGWYHVIMSVHEKYTEMYIGKPGMDPLTGEKWNVFYQYHGSEGQDLNAQAVEWGLGAPSGSNSKDVKLDDFRVYNWPLDSIEVTALHLLELQSPDVVSVSDNIQSATITEEVILPDLIFKNIFSPDMFGDGNEQNVNILDLDLNRDDFEVKIVNSLPEELPDDLHSDELYCDYYYADFIQFMQPTSTITAQNGGIAGINGTYFSWYKLGIRGWQSYIEADGEVGLYPDILSAKNEAALAFDFSKDSPVDKVRMYTRGVDLGLYEENSEMLANYQNVISGGHYGEYGSGYIPKYPDGFDLATLNENDCQFEDEEIFSDRLGCNQTDYDYMSLVEYCRLDDWLDIVTARTFVGIKDNHLLMGTFDGDAAPVEGLKGVGISIEQLHTFKNANLIDQIMTFDGGGSANVWINGQGVKNDIHKAYMNLGVLGQRPVPNSLVIVPKVKESQIPDDLTNLTTNQVAVFDGDDFIDLSKYYTDISGSTSGLIMGKFKMSQQAIDQEDEKVYTIFSVSRDALGEEINGERPDLYNFNRLVIRSKENNTAAVEFQVYDDDAWVTGFYTVDMDNLFDGNWHSFAITFPDFEHEIGGDEQRIDIDHQRIDITHYANYQNNFTNVVNATHVHIGTTLISGRYHEGFDGSLDDVILFTDLRQFEQANIEEYRNQDSHEREILSGGHYWNFEETEGYHSIDLNTVLNYGRAYHGLNIGVTYASKEAPNRTFAFVGDGGCTSYTSTFGAPASDVAYLVKSWSPEAIFSVGDDNYNDYQALAKADEIIQCGRYVEENIGNYYAEFVEQGTYYSVLGNHDLRCVDYEETNVHSAACADEWFDYLTLPENPTLDSYPERYYDVVIGDVHFIGLNAPGEEGSEIFGDELWWNIDNQTGSEQAMWLKNTLDASISKFQVVYLHSPPYSSIDYSEVGTIHAEYREALRTIPYKEWGVDIVISGDDHYYERFIQDETGLTFVVNGVSGLSWINFDAYIEEENWNSSWETNPVWDQPIYDLGLEDYVNATKINLSDVTRKKHVGYYGALKCQAYDDRLVFKFYNRDGIVNDVFEIFPDAEPNGAHARIGEPHPTLVESKHDVGLRIYPNPITEKLIIEGDNWISDRTKVKIFDLAGREVFSKSYKGVTKHHIIEINKVKKFLKSGTVYLVELENGPDRESRRILVD